MTYSFIIKHFRKEAYGSYSTLESARREAVRMMERYGFRSGYTTTLIAEIYRGTAYVGDVVRHICPVRNTTWYSYHSVSNPKGFPIYKDGARKKATAKEKEVLQYRYRDYPRKG